MTRNKYYIIQVGNSCDTPREILKHLHKRIPGLKEVYTVEECDVILVFCPIVSRAGTDMEAALNELNRCSASKPVVFMVLHHTFEREKIVPDSSRFVNRENTLTVNFLFNEDVGLLKCAMNDKALIKIIEHFKPQMLRQMGGNWLWYIIISTSSMLFFLCTATIHVITKSVQILWQQVKNQLWFIISTAANIVGLRTVQNQNKNEPAT
ncbi:uncharacterized protein LOC130563716 [Triplophysa rosa]|uniref:uncharacterized protein LOC130563716 n=1 Tax=Triplophysa rosa TaxID=992332 RepID=UPI0025462139|nr:uncharacterized protein LOC130563716 [Triplophysa rosa]